MTYQPERIIDKNVLILLDGALNEIAETVGDAMFLAKIGKIDEATSNWAIGIADRLTQQLKQTDEYDDLREFYIDSIGEMLRDKQRLTIERY